MFAVHHDRKTPPEDTPSPLSAAETSAGSVFTWDTIPALVVAYPVALSLRRTADLSVGLPAHFPGQRDRGPISSGVLPVATACHPSGDSAPRTRDGMGTPEPGISPLPRISLAGGRTVHRTRLARERCRNRCSGF